MAASKGEDESDLDFATVLRDVVLAPVRPLGRHEQARVGVVDRRDFATHKTKGVLELVIRTMCSVSVDACGQGGTGGS